MDRRPFQYFRACWARKLSFKEHDRIDPNFSFLIAAFGMERRRLMITIEPRDLNSIEYGKSGLVVNMLGFKTSVNAPRYNGCFMGMPGLRGYLGGVAATFATTTR